MQENIIEVRVFISCPGDVTEEKDMIRAVIETVNNTLLNTNSFIRFKVLDWRDIVAKMDGRAQEQINDTFYDYDIYIGILWMRFGTPTGALNPTTNTEYQSGTEEEFRLALQKYEVGQKINMYIFFKEAKQLSLSSSSETKQFLKVQEFYEEVRKLGWILLFPNKPQSVEFNNKIHSILWEWVRKMEKDQLIIEKEAFLEQPPQSVVDVRVPRSDAFIEKAAKIEHAIQRSIIAFEDQKDRFEFFFDKPLEMPLTDLVVEQKRVVLLGNAGSGKSVELCRLAHFYTQPETSFIPVYQRMNIYVEQPIEDFLPTGWKEIPERNALIILDGLDEVQPQHFNTAVRNILTFADRFSELRMVVSCRTNFYHFPEKTSGGTLTDFKVYFLSDIPGNKLYGYADEYFQIDIKAFVAAVQDANFTDLSKQPFFLNLLLKQFKIHNHLRIDRVELMDFFLQERITLDQAHFEHTTNLMEQKQRILNLLKRVALSMEAMGKNFVTYEELQVILPKPEDIKLLKFSTAFQSSGTGTWGFDHNNIQEYLAASALMQFEIPKIKDFLSFNNERIKPSWVNTLFFLMSVIGEEEREVLIEWILKLEPEVLVKIEVDKVDEGTRFQIFAGIFKYYKDQKVWLRSNKYTEKELAIFAPQERAADYLLNELSDNKNVRITRLNALHLLRYLNLKGEKLKEASAGIKKFMGELSTDGYAVFDSIHALRGLGLANAETVNYLMENFGARGNQYIRAAMYSIVITAGLVNEFIDYFINGLTKNLDKDDRMGVSLMDEGHMLREGLGLASSYQALKKLLKIFKNSFDRRLVDFFDKKEVFQRILDNAKTVAICHPNIIDDVYDVYLAYGRPSEETTALQIAFFFKQLGRGDEIFKRLFSDPKIELFEKGLLLRQLLNSKMTDYIVKQYEDRDITNKNLLELYNNIIWTRFNEGYEDEFRYLTDQLNMKTQALADLPKVDFVTLRRQREQANFDLYFSADVFQSTLEGFYKELGENEVGWEQVWKLHHYGLNEKLILPEAIFDLLSDFTRQNETVTLERALQFIKREKDFEKYRYRQIKEKLENTPGFAISEKQKLQIEKWVKSTLLSTDIIGAIKISTEDPNRFTYNGLAMVLWYFIKKYQIIADEQKLLDFTLFDERRNNDDAGFDFEAIEKLVGTKKLHQRVLQNIKNGIAYDRAWKNNAIYALVNGISDAESSILKDLSQTNKSFYIRNAVLTAFAELPGTGRALMALLKVMGTDELKWAIIDIVKDRPEIQDDFIAYLKEVLEKEYYSETQKFLASKYLTEKGIPEGTRHYIDFLLNKAEPEFDFYHEAVYLRIIKDISFLPDLLDLLKKAKSEEYTSDDFNRFDAIVSDTIFSIGLISEQNLLRVKSELVKFIDENIGKLQHVNFLYPIIDRMEFSFYLSKTQNKTVYDAVKEVNAVLPRE
jgi:hypothetical protein